MKVWLSSKPGKDLPEAFDGQLVPVIHAVLPLEDIRKAHELLEAGGVFGKLVITPGGEG